VPYKYVPVTSFEQAKAADQAGLLWIANFSKEERARINGGDPDWRNAQEYIDLAYWRPGHWESKFAKDWPTEDFAVLVEYDDDDDKE
jgi:hypothetical protein